MANIREILWKNKTQQFDVAAQHNFETLVDCLIFFILKNTNLKNGATIVSKLEEQ